MPKVPLKSFQKMASKCAKVFVLDHNQSMIDSGNYSKTVKIVMRMLENIMFADRKGDQIGIIIVGTQSSNSMVGENILDLNRYLGSILLMEIARNF